MIGSLFAGTYETPGKLVRLFKSFRGMGSVKYEQRIQIDISNQNKKTRQNMCLKE